MFDLNGKIALVTGASGLLGTQHTKALLGAGAKVVAADIKLPKSLESESCLPLEVDITQRSSLENALQTVTKKWGKIDVLVNNAAINDMFENPLLAGEQSKFENYPLELWEKMFSVNVTGMFLCCQVLGSHMASRKSGSIINVASTYGLVGPNQDLYINEKGEQTFYKSPSYSATKGAVISFTKFLAAYWGKSGVRVNTLTPGGVENQQDPGFVQRYSKRTPLGRMADPKDFQGALVFLASDASGYMTGANLVVDGGWTTW